MIQPENKVEATILADPQISAGFAYGQPTKGHAEGQVGVHVQMILDFIEQQDWSEYREDLRVMALIHDSFKYRQHGKIPYILPGPGDHAVLAAQYYAELKPGDERVRKALLHHDTYWRFYKRAQDGVFDERLFREIYEHIDLDLLIRFNYADSCFRDNTPVQWFEQKARELLENKPALIRA